MFPLKSHFLSFMCRMSRSGEMTRNSNALKHDGSMMTDLDLVDFLRAVDRFRH